MKRNFFTSILIIALLAGCASNKIDYFSVYTSPEYDGPEITAPLQIVLSEGIEDQFILSKQYLSKDYLVSDFRKTVTKNIQNTFKKSFTSVSIVDQLSNDGLVLVINRVNPEPYMPSVDKHDASIKECITLNCSLFTLYQYDFTLYENGKEINNWKRNLLSIAYVRNIGLYKGTFKYGLRTMCEDISEKILVDNELSYLVSETTQ